MRASRWLWIFAVWVLFVSFGWAKDKDEESALRLYDRAYAQYQKGHLRTAEKHLRRLLEQYPDAEVVELAVYLRNTILEQGDPAKTEDVDVTEPVQSIQEAEIPSEPVQEDEKPPARKDEKPPALPAVTSPSQSPLPVAANGAGLNLTVAQVAGVSVRPETEAVEVLAGESVTIGLKVTNLGNGEDGFSLVAQSEPSGLAVSFQGEGAQEIQGTTALQPGAPFQGAVTLSVPSESVDGQSWSVGVRGVSLHDPQTEASCRIRLSARRPQLRGGFKLEAASVKPGTEVRWDLVCENASAVKAGGVSVSCSYPAELDWIDASPSATLHDTASRRLTWDIQELPGSEAFSAKLRFKVKDNALAGQGLRLWGASSSSLCPKTDFLSPSVSVLPVQGIQLAQPESGVETTPGAEARLSFKVTNSGNAPESLSITGTWPEGVVADCRSLEGVSLQKVESLEARGELACVLVVKAPESARDGEILKGEIQVTSAVSPDLSSRLPMEVLVRAPSVSVSLSTPGDQIKPGSTLRYELLCTNKGSGVAKDVRVQEQFCGDLKFLSSDPSGEQKDGQNVLWSLAELAAGETVKIVVETSVPMSLKAGSLLTSGTSVSWRDRNGRLYP